MKILVLASALLVLAFCVLVWIGLDLEFEFDMLKYVLLMLTSFLLGTIFGSMVMYTAVDLWGG